MNIINNDNYYIVSTLDKVNEKVAIFDLDDTIIKTRSGRKFAKDSMDWKFWDDGVVNKLREYNDNGYSIIFFSNQGGLKTDKGLKEHQKKVKSIIRALEIPIVGIFSLKKDKYRKPNVGMMELLKGMYEGKDYKDVFYVGDAAGRDKDFSCSDRKFAYNMEIRFYTPEEFFLNKSSEKYELLDFNKYKGEYNIPTLYPDENEVILFIGPPASGKTSYYNNFLKENGYMHLNLDTLKTRGKIETMYKNNIGKVPIVIDETSADKNKRSVYIKIAQDNNIKIRAFLFTTAKEIREHNNYYRALVHNKKLIPDIVYRMYNKNYSEPSLNEGFAEVNEIPFVINTNDEKYYKYYV